MKKAILRILAMIAVFIAAAIVFSPLVAALGATGLDARSVTSAFRTAGKPLAGSAEVALISALVAVALGLPFALLVESSRLGLRRAFWTLGLIVLMVPAYIVGEAWIVLLGPAGKISKAAVMLLSSGPQSTDQVRLARFEVPGFVYTRPVVGLVMGGCLFPIVALAVASAYRRTDRRVFESARIAQGRRGVWKIAASVLVPPALGAGLLVGAVTLTEFGVPQLLRVRTVGESIYERIQEGELGMAAALSLPLLPLILAAGALGARLLSRSRVASMAGLEGEVPAFDARGGGRAIDLSAGIMTLIAITPSLILPTISLIWLASIAKLPEASAYGAHRVLRASGFREALRGAWELASSDAIRTIFLAALAATVATGFAVALVRLTARVGWGPYLGALGAGLAVPAPMSGSDSSCFGIARSVRWCTRVPLSYCSRSQRGFCRWPSFSSKERWPGFLKSWKVQPRSPAGARGSGSLRW